jgi:hypothetical protein
MGTGISRVRYSRLVVSITQPLRWCSFFSSVFPSPSGAVGPGSVQNCLLRARETRKRLISNDFSHTWFASLQRGLPGGHPKRCDPSRHAPEQPPRQVALRQRSPTSLIVLTNAPWLPIILGRRQSRKLDWAGPRWEPMEENRTYHAQRGYPER